MADATAGRLCRHTDRAADREELDLLRRPLYRCLPAVPTDPDACRSERRLHVGGAVRHTDLSARRLGQRLLLARGLLGGRGRCSS